MNSTINNEITSTKIGRIAIQLFAFLQQCRLNASVVPHSNKILTYQFSINDITNEGVPFGLSFDLSSEDVDEIEDTPKAIENFCYSLTIKTGTALLTEKATRLLQYAEETAGPKSRIILPGQ